MRSGGGSRKGGGFEREMAKWLSSFWSLGSNQDLCWRSSSSGGRVKLNKRKMSHLVYGDLSPISADMEPFFNKFCVELKHYKELTADDLLGAPGSNILKFINQTVDEADGSNRWPILIYKANFYPTRIVIRDVTVNEFWDCLSGKPPRHLTFTGMVKRFKVEAMIKFYIFNLEELAAIVDANKLRIKLGAKSLLITRQAKTDQVIAA